MTADDSERSVLDLQVAAEEFFRRALGDAKERRDLQTTPDAEMYLVALLSAHARKPGLGEVVEPYGVRLVRALRASGGERFMRLRTLGDDALFISGFYADHLEHRGLDADYVADLGRVAYGGVASILRTHTGPSKGVFDELAERFVTFVDLLRHVADSLVASAANDEAALLDLYERWSRTGSTVLADALLRQGLAPKRGPSGLN
jgi:hypothetical protein